MDLLANFNISRNHIRFICTRRTGLKFAIPLTFIAIIVQDLKKIDHVIVMLVCGISSLLFFDAPFKSYIIISPIVALFAAALILRFKK